MTTIENLYRFFQKHPRISIDTRTDVTNSIYFSLSGENFNGNSFAQKAIEQGALLAVIDDEKYKMDERFFLVEDSLNALQELAVFHRKLNKIPVLAITGSNGKTTTKELVAAVLGKKYSVTCTKGNLNNHIGVPMTLLDINRKTEIAIVEMGANHQGEIDLLCKIAKPDFGLITNIGKAHIEGFGSYQGVINAKSELFDFLKSTGGEIFVNADDKLLMDLSKEMKRLTYGTNDAEIIGNIQSTMPTVTFKWKSNSAYQTCNSQLYGSYNFYNMLAAVATGIKFNVAESEIKKAIEAYIPVNNRSQLVNTKTNRIILDAYNANPVSMSEAIKNFADYKPTNPWLIIGDMFELGEIAREEHKSIIDLLGTKAFSNVLLVGQEFYQLKNSNEYLSFKTTNDVMDYLGKNKIEDATILIKGSRGMKLEQLLIQL